MVWFQCEDCGDNLKKPKLPNHFRICSASKLSCIDCGKIFGRLDVEGHTQCITESEKYGPKGQGNDRNGSNAKPSKSPSQKPDVDINVGLSETAPWFCSLCNTKATSKQTLLLHADGKKHRAKARAFHANQQQAKELEATSVTISTTNGQVDTHQQENTKELITNTHDQSAAENGDSEFSKKRKLEASENAAANQKSRVDITIGLGNEEVQVQKPETAVRNQGKKANQAVSKDENTRNSCRKEEDKENIKWKKLIKLILKSNPDGVLKFKKLKRLVLKSLKESNYEEDENTVTDLLKQKINSSSRFVTEGKYVRLATKS